ncbi:dipeptide/oligopeptide/nickel ABC transporter permease/ATP-binding protein [Microbacterium sp. STN6]|uniref:dipeptide/oligopeptide/nickel ABC transporter permease/ATP-binding protein n=1 Tax=Microbacterium sp. STN6 TaxID=2995588 RepID=UPI0022609337|nr:dipeptide/oligopeptide/nickel ABC transporter permease/ATP-binding protein [Microbacterium sp. STN6]MCX7520699.1 dipeptide/oligopeptide/nickel ABC transporter permease/ATP-binding protein [Microbacterium sp. STN6]
MNRSNGSRAMSAGLVRRVLRKPLGVVSGVVLILIVGASFAGQWIAPHDPLAQNLRIVRQGPSVAHLLGTDSLGRDVLSRLLFGGQESLSGVVVAVVAMLIIAIPLGILAGYVGGLLDRVILRVVDVLLSIPGTIITLAVLAIFNNNMFVAMVSVGVLASGAFIRVFRSAALSVRQELYIGAARVSGLSRVRIMANHVLPQIRGVLLVQVTLFSAATLGIQTGLAFLAFGPPPPSPTWGGMVAEAATIIQIDPWLLVPTGGVIALTTLALCLLGDAVRDANQERFTLAGLEGKPSAPQAGKSQVHTTGADRDDEARMAVTPGALLSVRGLTVGFGAEGRETTAIQRVDFDIHPGEVVGLVGESGSGKTVTALALLGLLGANGRVTGGSIRLSGEELVGMPHARLREVRGARIAMISQEPMVALDPSFRVGSQIAEAVRAHDRVSRADARARCEELLAAVRLDPAIARRYPHEISGGMAQRVAIAMALAGRPELLIADEPTTALDVTVQADILDLLRTVQEETQMAVILVSHDWGVVADLCSRAIVMYAGEVVERARVADVFAAPRHPYTTALLRSNPHGAEPGKPLPTIGGSVPAPQEWPVGCHFAARCPLATEACRVAPIDIVHLEGDRASRCIHIDELAEVRA